MANVSSDRNSWDYFWSEYMVWSLRLICYFSNELFWDSTKGSLDAVISTPFVSDAILWSYSILCFGFIEKKIEQKYKPKYEGLGLSDEVYYYRVRKERVIFTAWIFCGVNFVLETLASLIVYGQFSFLAVLGLFWPGGGILVHHVRLRLFSGAKC